MYCKTCTQWTQIPESDLLTRMKYGERSGECLCEVFAMLRSTGMMPTVLKPGGIIRWHCAETGGRFITDQVFGCVHHEYDRDIEEL